MYPQRHDFGVRLGAEKAQLPDEAITRSQIVAGTNITIDYLPNWDIRINALTGGGGGAILKINHISGRLGIGIPFQRSGSIGLDRTGAGGTRQAINHPRYNDIHHGWNLLNPYDYQFTWESDSDITTPGGNWITEDLWIRHKPISANAIRVYCALFANNYEDVSAMANGFPASHSNDSARNGDIRDPSGNPSFLNVFAGETTAEASLTYANTIINRPRFITFALMEKRD